MMACSNRRAEEREAAAAALQRKEADILGRLEAEAAEQRAKVDIRLRVRVLQVLLGAGLWKRVM